MPRRRIALYSHDTQGLGHVRRNIEIAASLVAGRPDTDVLLLTGTPAAAALPLPAGTELVVLPGVAKDGDGGYSPASLGLGLDELLELRSRMIETAIAAFAPDLFVVDKVARGMGGELDAALRTARRTVGPRGLPTRTVLGLRDILDTPAVARREWDAAGTTDAVLDLYDEVWVYGDPRVHDPVAAYGLGPEVGAMVRFTGYLARGRGRHLPPVPSPLTPTPGTAAAPTPYVLCLVGGGQDGHALADALARTALPAGHHAVLVTGPCMPLAERQRLAALAAARDDLVVHTFVEDTLPLIAGAAAVVSMGGYNTVCELLASGRPPLVVPRTTPRLEQTLRVHELGPWTELDHLAPDAATPEALASWLADAVRRPPAHHTVDLDGLERLPALADALLAPDHALELRHVSA